MKHFWCSAMMTACVSLEITMVNRRQLLVLVLVLVVVVVIVLLRFFPLAIGRQQFDALPPQLCRSANGSGAQNKQSKNKQKKSIYIWQFPSFCFSQLFTFLLLCVERRKLKSTTILLKQPVCSPNQHDRVISAVLFLLTFSPELTRSSLTRC